MSGLRPFQHYSTKELLNLLMVSKICTFPKLVKKTDSLISASSSIIGLNPTSFYVGKLIGEVFSAGETLSDLKSTLNSLSAIKQGMIIGYCAEGVTSELGMDETLSQILATVQMSSKHPNASISIKLTSLIPEQTLRKLSLLQKSRTKSVSSVWEDSIFYTISEKSLLEEGFSQMEVKETINGLARVQQICAECEKFGIQVLIDAEQTYFQHAIDGITALYQREFNKRSGVVLATIQSYLKDSQEKLQGNLHWTSTNNLNTGVKLVRGAYIKEETFLSQVKNYPCPIHSSKKDTDDCYNSNLKIIVSALTRNGSFVIASHNKTSIFYAKDLLDEYRVHRLYGGISFGQLLGFKAVISSYLAHENYVVKKYVPFGPFNKLMPYMGRRAHELAEMGVDIENQIELVVQELSLRN